MKEGLTERADESRVESFELEAAKLEEQFLHPSLTLTSTQYTIFYYPVKNTLPLYKFSDYNGRYLIDTSKNVLHSVEEGQGLTLGSCAH